MSEREGKLGISIANEGEFVILQFSTKTDWIALTPEAAQEIAGVLLERAKKCPGYKPLIITTH